MQLWCGASQDHPIGTMSLVTASLTLGGMLERTSKSSSAAAPALELSHRADAADPTGMRGGHVRGWRDAANQMARAYERLGLVVPEAPRLIEGDGAGEGRHVHGPEPPKVRVFADALAPGHAAGYLRVATLRVSPPRSTPPRS